jgi:transcriptional regulator with GAF, ATPase, and Fis domain
MKGTPIIRPVAAPIPGATPVPTDPNGFWLPSLDVVVAEELLIDEALQRAGGNRTKAATLLNMSVRTLRHKLNAAGKEE